MLSLCQVYLLIGEADQSTDPEQASVLNKILFTDEENNLNRLGFLQQINIPQMGLLCKAKLGWAWIPLILALITATQSSQILDTEGQTKTKQILTCLSHFSPFNFPWALPSSFPYPYLCLAHFGACSQREESPSGLETFLLRLHFSSPSIGCHLFRIWSTSDIERNCEAKS